MSLWLTRAPKQSFPSLGPRPTPFWSSVCVHNNTQERKTGLLLPSIVNAKGKMGGGLGTRLIIPHVCSSTHPAFYHSSFVCAWESLGTRLALRAMN